MYHNVSRLGSLHLGVDANYALSGAVRPATITSIKALAGTVCDGKIAVGSSPSVAGGLRENQETGNAIPPRSRNLGKTGVARGGGQTKLP